MPKKKTSTKPVLILRNLDGTAIQTLGYAFNVQAEFAYNEVSTVTFDLPEHVNGEKTPHYDDVVGMRIIELRNNGNKIGQFVLVDPETSSDGVTTIKSCQAYSLEYEFAKKTITLEEGTYNFWDPMTPDDTILGRILEKLPSWSVGNVDSSLIGKYRTFDVIEDKVYDFMKSEVQESYGCIFDFDTYQRKVNVISVESVVETKPVYLSTERLIKEIDIEEDSDSIITCLDVNGADGVNIRSVNPTGTNKIYNLDYFMNETNFSDDMIGKWRRWETDYKNYRGVYYNATIAMNLQTARKLTEQAGYEDLKAELTALENTQAAVIERISENKDDNTELKEINKQIAIKKSDINVKEDIMAEIDGKLQEYDETIKQITSSLDWSKYFSPSEISILQRYVIEDSVQDSSFAPDETATYDNEDVLATIEDQVLSLTNTSIQTSDTESGEMHTLEGGNIKIGSVTAKIVKATIETNSSPYSDYSFLLTAYVNRGTINSEAFESGNITIIGQYSQMSRTNIGMTVMIDSATQHFTKNSSEYEKHMIEWDLYEYGEQVLLEKASPTYNFSIDSGNFLAAKDFITFKNSLTLGKRVYLKLNDDEVVKPYVTKVSIDYEDAASLSLEFSSSYTSFDKQFKLAKLLEQSVSLGKTLDLKGGVYEQFVKSGASNRVKDFMDSALDIAKNTVMSSGHQAIEFGDAGIRVRKWKTDGNGNQIHEYEPEEIWIVDNVIAFTDNNWDTSCMAIGKIFDEGFGDYVKATKDYDKSKVYCYKDGDKYTPYTYNPDNWDSTWPNLWCKEGGVKYGIAAPYLVGTILAGKNLFIGTDDGFFRVDDNGVYLLNEKLIIASSDGNGLTFTANDGLVHKVTVNGTRYEAGFGAMNSKQRGLYFNVNGDDKLYWNIARDTLVVDGYIYARDLFLGENRVSVLEKCGWENERTKISGTYLEGRGFRAYDDSGKMRVEIDGSDGSMHIYNGYISIERTDRYGEKNGIYIDPDAGITFEKVTSSSIERPLFLDINTGDAYFSGNITASAITSSEMEASKITGSQIIGSTFFAVPEHIYDSEGNIIPYVPIQYGNGSWDLPGVQRLVIDKNGIVSYNEHNEVNGIRLAADSGFGTLEFAYRNEWRGDISQSSGSIFLNAQQRFVFIAGTDIQFTQGTVKFMTTVKFNPGITVDFEGANVVGLPTVFG